ncbi:MAG: hypothetical protein A2Y57_00260 [Candidatus Woykebacteria bacterium RBG_13_40_7b]|uniref:RRM domain-containing protein n=1 Tax=Candidatus Woykebacteria bacterium RBG_13_40_7b TaxID=1802594 RepID=A0A1G1WB38_9BACT|nr:MAG: hypothetical protein A2Y57_00260 [Candidatus Woykebacteria bacterium RBG_13_40_7b]
MKLFIGNLPWKTTEEDLKSMFSEAGSPTSVNLITDRNTGRSRGFGFVEYETDEEGNKAIEQLNGKEIEDRKIVVNVARPLQPR